MQLAQAAAPLRTTACRRVSVNPRRSCTPAPRPHLCVVVRHRLVGCAAAAAPASLHGVAAGRHAVQPRRHARLLFGARVAGDEGLVKAAGAAMQLMGVVQEASARVWGSETIETLATSLPSSYADPPPPTPHPTHTPPPPPPTPTPNPTPPPPTQPQPARRSAAQAPALLMPHPGEPPPEGLRVAAGAESRVDNAAQREQHAGCQGGG